MAFKVLVVDDEKDLRDLISYFLKRASYDVEVAENGLEAFKIVQSWHPQLVISDVRMPVSDGFELIENITAMATPFIPVLFISGYGGGDEAKLKQNPHCVGFVSKPVKKTDLINYVKKIEMTGRID